MKRFLIFSLIILSSATSFSASSKRKSLHWTDKEKNNLNTAVTSTPLNKRGAIPWATIALAVGKSPRQCESYWMEKLDPNIKRNKLTYNEIKLIGFLKKKGWTVVQVTNFFRVMSLSFEGIHYRSRQYIRYRFKIIETIKIPFQEDTCIGTRDDKMKNLKRLLSKARESNPNDYINYPYRQFLFFHSSENQIKEAMDYLASWVGSAKKRIRI